MLSAPTRPSLSRLCLAAAIAGVLTCGGATEEQDPVAVVVITAPTGALSLRTLGRQVQFAAEARDAAGNALPDAAIRWYASVPGAITASGLFTAISPGTVTVSARSGIVNSAPFAVTIAPLALSVTITPESLTFHSTGRAQALVIQARDSSGALLTQGVTSVVANPTVASLFGLQNVSALADGHTEVIATADGAADTARVAVSLVPASIVVSGLAFHSHTSRTLTATVKDSAAQTIPGYPIQFESEDTSVATVTPQGLVVPGAEGLTHVRVSAGPVSVTVPMVVQYVIASVQILPNHLTFYTVSRPQHLELYAFDSTGVNIGRLPDSAAGRTGAVTWHSFAWYISFVPSGSGVDVYPEYQYDFALLNANYDATWEGYSLMSVWWYPTTFGLVAPQTSIAVGDSTIITAFARDSSDSDLFSRAPFFWLSTDQSVAWVTSDFGIHEATITGLAPGTSWIHMFGAGREDSVLVTVH